MNTIQLDSFRYQAGEIANWSGRASRPGLEAQYWHQAIQLVDLKLGLPSLPKPDITLLGYACDEGVRRNLGRVGAVHGPEVIRNNLAKLAFHHAGKNILDLGDITCQDGDMEASQHALADVVSQLIRNQAFPILMGGGHDIAYGHFHGLFRAARATRKAKLGILNFDAHFDLRPVEKLPNSGTPFWQILQEHPHDVEYLVLGIQSPANSPELFEIAQKYKVQHLSNFDCEQWPHTKITQFLDPFIERNDWIYLSIDLDGFSSAYAPGVSAPSPMGFNPSFVFQVLSYLFQSRKVISCDLAELNPKLDIDQHTAKLAARLIDQIVHQL